MTLFSSMPLLLRYTAATLFVLLLMFRVTHAAKSPSLPPKLAMPTKAPESSEGCFERVQRCCTTYIYCGRVERRSAASATCRVRRCGAACFSLCRRNDDKCMTACRGPPCVRFAGYCRVDTVRTYATYCARLVCSAPQARGPVPKQEKGNYTDYSRASETSISSDSVAMPPSYMLGPQSTTVV